MARTRRGLANVSDPIFRLALNPLCEPPPPGLTMEQHFAIHQYLHTIIAEGYKLYQKVPIELASSVLQKKFQMMASNPSKKPDKTP
jgi:hypothetical protein